MDDIFFSNSEESKQEVKENFETNNLAPAIDISEDKKEIHNNHQSDEMTENNSSYVELNEEIRKRDIIIEQLKIQNQNINENYQTLLKEISALKQQMLAPKEAQEKSANDSVGYGGSQSSQEYSNLTNQDVKLLIKRTRKFQPLVYCRMMEAIRLLKMQFFQSFLLMMKIQPIIKLNFLY